MKPLCMSVRRDPVVLIHGNRYLSENMKEGSVSRLPRNFPVFESSHLKHVIRIDFALNQIRQHTLFQSAEGTERVLVIFVRAIAMRDVLKESVAVEVKRSASCRINVPNSIPSQFTLVRTQKKAKQWCRNPMPRMLVWPRIRRRLTVF